MSSQFYGSDCTNAYGMSGGGYSSTQSACQACTTSTQDILNNNYTFVDACQNAPSSADGNRYISDGVNYYVSSGFSVLDDHSVPANACASPHNYVLSSEPNAVLAGQCASSDAAQSLCNCVPSTGVAPGCGQVTMCQAQMSNATIASDQEINAQGEEMVAASGAIVGGVASYNPAFESFTLFHDEKTKTVVLVLLSVAAVALGAVLLMRLLKRSQ